jgi:hypothetical protein
MDSPIGTSRHARTACLPCRTGKRKCDKVLPSCGLCIRRDVGCRYPLSPRWDPLRPESAAGSISSPTSLSSDHDSALTTAGNYHVASAVHFVAPRFFQQAQLELPRPGIRGVHLPDNLASFVDDLPSIRSIATAFFATTHPWLPIVSKQTYYRSLLNPLSGRKLELTLITLSMKLSGSAPEAGLREIAARSSLYTSTKALHANVEGAGMISITVLQANLLIALYEMSHAIYPAAYLTVGACARYGLALGLHDSASIHGAPGLLCWNDVEERRRVWWAVLTFDRCVSCLTSPKEPN